MWVGYSCSHPKGKHNNKKRQNTKNGGEVLRDRLSEKTLAESSPRKHLDNS
ncbi:hypothetical protein SESBI_30788 [Sesbania bispinosa]|nr:hypothetical protein SESBI_30788 [Sesbania bispinosa]